MEEYLTIGELAARLKLKPRTIRNKMAAGVFRKGDHYFSPPGLGPRFKWSAVVRWLEQGEAPAVENSETGPGSSSVPMPRHYRLRVASRKQVAVP